MALRRWPLMALCLGTLAACGPEPVRNPSAEAPARAPAADPAPEPGPAAVVAALYRLDKAPIADPATAGLLSRDVVAAAARDSDPNLDYRFGSMGPGTADIRTGSEPGAAPAEVLATITVGEAQQTVRWLLCRSADGGWRVYDASDGHYSLRGRLRLNETEIDCG